MKLQLNKLAKEIHRGNVKRGFWDKKRNEGEVLMLCITECAEIVEAHREAKRAALKTFEREFKRASKFKYSKKEIKDIQIGFFKEYVKDTVEDEFADTIIRLLDYSVGFNKKNNEGKIYADVRFYNKYRIFKNLGEELLAISGVIADSNYYFVDDALSRLIWLAHKLGINLEKHIYWKMWYNSTRGKMHGKKY